MSSMPAGDNPFDFLFKAEPRAISALLAKESPSTAAVVIARLPRLLAAKVIADFPPDVRGKIVASMREPRSVPGDVLEEIAAGFRSRLGGQRQSVAPRINPVPASQAKTFAEMLGNPGAVGAAPAAVPPPARSPSRHRQLAQQGNTAHSSGTLMEGAPPPPSAGSKKVTYGGTHVAAALVRYLAPEVRHQLQNEEPALFAQISQFMFTFDDLLKTEERSLQVLLAEVDDRRLSIAMKVAAPALRKHLLACVSPRRASLLDEAIERQGQVRISDIEKAQEEIVSLGMAMQAKGRILLDPDAA